MSRSVRVRFAPSPTGFLHIGGVRTAIFNAMFARRYGGKYILRIEDTDRERSTPQAVEQIFDSLRWLDLLPDEEPLFQSKRTDIYQRYIKQLLDQRLVYRCYCSQEELDQKRQSSMAAKTTYKYDGTCRQRDPHEDPAGREYTLRFRTPDVYPDSYDDLILGRIPIDSERLDDWIVARKDGTPTYNFCVVVDDAEMGITHVIRGNDHVANTPKQILLYQALGLAVPAFAHMPLTHGPDGSKLSKRKEEQYQKLGISINVQQYRKMGYLPHALVNYLARLGWSHGDQELFTRQELEQKFDLHGVGKSASVMDPEKLRWINAHYLKETADADLAELIRPFFEEMGYDESSPARLIKIVATLKERSKTLVELAENARFYYIAPTAYDPKAVKKWWKGQAKTVLNRLQALLPSLDLDQGAEVENQFRKLADELCEGKLGKIAQPLRVALSGKAATPSLFEVMPILGQQEINQRIRRALAALENKE